MSTWLFYLRVDKLVTPLNDTTFTQRREATISLIILVSCTFIISEEKALRVRKTKGRATNSQIVLSRSSLFI